MLAGDAPTRVPGPTAGAVGWRALRWPALGVLCIPALVLQSLVPAQGLWVACWLTAALTCVALFFLALRRARDLERAEVARGYTTVLRLAQEQPGLWLLDPETGAALSAPHQERPPDVRPATVRAWLAERGPA